MKMKYYIPIEKKPETCGFCPVCDEAFCISLNDYVEDGGFMDSRCPIIEMTDAKETVK